MASISSKRKLMENFFSLVVLQGVNYVLPLLTLPYLVRVLGPTNYGLIAFAQSLVTFFIIFTDYGFNLSGTRQIALYREERDKISRTFNSILYSKIVLMVVSFIVYFILIFNVPRFEQNVDIFMITIGMLLGNVLLPIWFFQGIEEMKFITFFNILSRLVSTLCIFIFVTNSDDLLLVPLFYTISGLIVGVVALFIVTFKFKIKITLPNLRDIQYQLKDGFVVFLSIFSTSFYTVSNTIILGFFANNTIVGYYASAEKIINALSGLINPISQTIYPHINRLLVENKNKAILFIRNIIKLVSFVMFGLSAIMFVFANGIVTLVLGPEYQESIIVIRIIAFLPLIIGLSNILGVQTLLSLGYQKTFSSILVSSSILNLIIAFIIVPHFGHIGTAISVLITELCVTISMLICVVKKGLLNSSKRKLEGN